jgi:hypothetical protein
MTRGWDVAHQRVPGSLAMRTRLQQDIAAGNVFRPA